MSNAYKKWQEIALHVLVTPFVLVTMVVAWFRHIVLAEGE